VPFSKYVNTFRRALLQSILGFKQSKTTLTTTRIHIPGDLSLKWHRSGNITSHKRSTFRTLCDFKQSHYLNGTKSVHNYSTIYWK